MKYPRDNFEGIKTNKINSKPGVTPVLILCDNSGSMQNHTDTVNKCIKELIDDIKEDSVIANSIDLSIISFNCECTEVLPFTIVSAINNNDVKPIVKSELATYFGFALKNAVDYLSKEKAKFKANMVDYTQPNLIVISDGKPEHEDLNITESGIEEVQNKIKTERWNCIPIFIGASTEDGMSHMKKISVPDKNGTRSVINFNSDSKTDNIIQAFKFASKSIGVFSNTNQSNSNPIPTNELTNEAMSTSKKRKTYLSRLNFNT